MRQLHEITMNITKGAGVQHETKAKLAVERKDDVDRGVDFDGLARE
jgi:hypothetical protein